MPRTLLNSIKALGYAFSIAVASLFPGVAYADSVVIKRNVTIREDPSRRSPVVMFPGVGTALKLLDDGARRSGYYHIELIDGRQGWVYFAFVERRSDVVPDGLVAAIGTDRVAVHYVNVDQGAATLLEFPCGAVMIDAGGRGQAASDHLIGYLEAFFARRPDLNRRIDTIFVTHTHVDHNSNLKRVAQTFAVGGYVHNGVKEGSGRWNAKWMIEHAPTAVPVIADVPVSRTDVVAAGAQGLTGPVIDPVACPRVDPKIRVLSGRYDENPGWPDGEFDNGNNQSLVIRVDYGQASFLFTGDLEEHAIETLVARYAPNNALDVDVYAVGHHGSRNGTTPGLLSAMTPEVAVMSMGPSVVQEMWTAWAYGHPRRTIVELLDGVITRRRPATVNVLVADNVKTFTAYPLTDAIYATGWDGDLTISAGADGVFQVDPGR